MEVKKVVVERRVLGRPMKAAQRVSREEAGH